MSTRGPVTLAVLADAIERVYLSSNAGATMLRMVRRVLKLLVEVGVHTTHDLDGDAIQRFEAALPVRGDHYRFEHLRTLRAICNHAVKLRLLAAAPPFPMIPHPPDIPTLGRIAVPSVDEMDRYLKYLRAGADASWDGHRGYALVCTITFAGLLRNEAMELRPADINLADGTIRVRRRESLKKGWLRGSIGTQNPVRISGRLRPILEAWLPEAGPDFVFPGKRGAGAWKTGSKPNEAHGWIKAAGLEAGLTTELNFEVLHQFHVANVVADIPGIGGLEPVQKRGLYRSGRGADPLAPTRELDIEEATRLMGELRCDSEMLQGHRAYAEAMLALLAGLRRDQIAGLGTEDIDLGRTPPRLVVPGRSPVKLSADAAEVIRQWINRPDWRQTEHVSPGLIFGRRGVSDAKANRLTNRLGKAAAAAGIKGRVTIESLRRLWKRCGGHVELGDAWRTTVNPAGPSSLADRREDGSRGAPNLATCGAPNLATWDPPIPTVRIGRHDEPIHVVGGVRDPLSRGAYEAIRILLAAFPGGLTRKEMDARYGGIGWRTALRRLRDNDPIWRSAILFPGDDGSEGDYRISAALAA